MFTGATLFSNCIVRIVESGKLSSSALPVANTVLFFKVNMSCDVNTKYFQPKPLARPLIRRMWGNKISKIMKG